MNKFQSVLQLLTSPRRLKTILSFNHKGYLAEIGWFKTFDSGTSVDQNGNIIPWINYSFIDFITPRLKKEHTMFEFGAGNSTYYYAKRIKWVVSVEHDKAWRDKIASSNLENVKLIYCELVRDGDYCRVPLTLNEKFDIIIVDGRDRVNCAKQAVGALSPNGVIVLDDSEREFYKEALDFMVDHGFKEITLTGITPGLFYRKATTIFYKSDNCLGI